MSSTVRTLIGDVILTHESEHRVGILICVGLHYNVFVLYLYCTELHCLVLYCCLVL